MNILWPTNQLTASVKEKSIEAEIVDCWKSRSVNDDRLSLGVVCLPTRLRAFNLPTPESSQTIFRNTTHQSLETVIINVFSSCSDI